MKHRLWLSIVVIAAALLAPWWVSIPLAFIVSLVIYRYYELLAVGIIIDSLYNTNRMYFEWPPTATIICIVLFLISIHLKQLLIFTRQ
jgi:hypothetical protein